MTPKTTNKSGLRKKSIFVVDDSKYIQDLLTEIARSVGLEAVTASSLREARTLCDRRAFDAAFVDLCLVEHDKQNRDGIILLRYILSKNEGTRSTLLTGYGDFKDAEEAVNELGAGIMKKSPELPEWEIKLREAMTQAAASSQLVPTLESSTKFLCGDMDPVIWQSRAKQVTKYRDVLEFTRLLDDLAETCIPLLERSTDNGLQKTLDGSAMAGIYWSRGIGDAIAVLLTHGELLEEVPRLDSWPTDLQIGEILYQTNRDQVYAAIVKCAGVAQEDFDVLLPKQ
jgi:ActR/RegA family two-component response regulator